MKLALERHAYAPELNRALVLRRGRVVAELPAPGARSIAEARRQLFPPFEPVRLVTAESWRPAPWQGLNRERSAGYPIGPGVMARVVADARKAMADAGGELLDGRTLPPSEVRLRTRLAYVPRRADRESA